jgi:thiamine-monophosphate kinase
MIVVAGELGAAAAGVELLRDGAGRKNRSLVAAYTRPVPRLDVVRALAGTGFVRGAIDVSDGLSSDLIHLCENAGERARAGRNGGNARAAKDRNANHRARRTHGVGCEIHAHALPIARGVRAFCETRGIDPVEWALHAGEDYALILSVPRPHAVAACRAIHAAGVRASIIGRFTAARGSYRIIVTPSRARTFRSGGSDHVKKAPR